MRGGWRGSRVGGLLAMALAALAGCTSDDDLAQQLMGERDQLRREVAGLRMLDTIARAGLIADDREVLVSVRDTLLQALLSAALPIRREINGGVTVELTSATMIFRSNVARVELSGTVTRNGFPRAAARMDLSGALQEFVVDSARRLHARIVIDDSRLSTPTGVPGALGPTALRVLQGILDRALPELTDALPEVALPVQVSHELSLPAIAPGGVISIAAMRTPLNLSVSKVIAFRDRLTVVLRLERGALERVAPDSAVGQAPVAASPAARTQPASAAAPATAGGTTRP